jgi:hypothetical protein
MWKRRFEREGAKAAKVEGLDGAKRENDGGGLGAL